METNTNVFVVDLEAHIGKARTAALKSLVVEKMWNVRHASIAPFGVQVCVDLGHSNLYARVRAIDGGVLVTGPHTGDIVNAFQTLLESIKPIAK